MESYRALWWTIKGHSGEQSQGTLVDSHRTLWWTVIGHSGGQSQDTLVDRQSQQNFRVLDTHRELGVFGVQKLQSRV